MKNFNREKIKEQAFVMVEALIITFITLAAVLPVSCKITEQGISILSGDYLPPVLNNYEVVDEKTLSLYFSEKVKVYGYVLSFVNDNLFASREHSDTIETSPAIERVSGLYSSLACSVLEGEEDGLIQVVLEKPMQPGSFYEFYSEVEDSYGNSLTIAIPFTGFNARVPKLLITEVQPESPKQTTSEARDEVYRSEFVEILVLKGGNLAGLELCNASGGEEKKYSFPALEVSTGELFLLHVQKRGSGCIDEREENLNLAYSVYARDGIRDLYTELEGSVLGNKTDIIILRNSADNKILDAFMYRESKTASWTKKNLEYARLVAQSGIYASEEIEEAFVSDKKTTVKSMYRVNAPELQLKALNGEEIEYPLKVLDGDWAIQDSPDPGLL